MGKVSHLPLARQLSLVMEELESELIGLSGGTIVVCIRNDVIGKFGVKHDALECRDGVMKPIPEGLSRLHVSTLRQMAIDVLKRKKKWTHGEISFDFSVKKGSMMVHIWFESNYNLVHMLENEQLPSYRQMPRAS
ncbi:O-methyltransferase [Paenibacillus sp. 481]|uniref:O-methyltransferase n=1 Tax=Paenibacillus sp. 481 TaxID=2835869 RepID=UPI001E2C43BB|nr:O-methyltransferase [Paenibacillus sp. 481]